MVVPLERLPKAMPVNPCNRVGDESRLVFFVSCLSELSIRLSDCGALACSLCSLSAFSCNSPLGLKSVC